MGRRNPNGLKPAPVLLRSSSVTLVPFPAAPLSTVLSNRFGTRIVVMGGGLLVSTGMVAASFSQTVYHMYVTIGIVSGKPPFMARGALDVRLENQQWGGREGDKSELYFFSL